MSDSEDKAAALIQLKELAEPDVSPKLSETELGKILDRCQRAMTWAPNIQVKTGSIFIAPLTANGRWYRVRVSGLTGASEPGWPSGGSSSSIADSAVRYEDAGEAQGGIYDIRAAAYEAWAMKCRKASKYPEMSGINVASIFDHCVIMRDSFTPVLVA